MKKRFMKFFVTVLFLLVLGSCKKEVPEKKGQTEFQKLPFKEMEAIVSSEQGAGTSEADEKTVLLKNKPYGAFTVSETGDIFLSENQEKICKYSMDGTLLHTYEEGKGADALCLMGDDLFVYTFQNELLRISTETGKCVTVAELMFVTEMQNLVTAGGMLYGLCPTTEDGQFDIKIKQIEPANGSVTNIEPAEGGVRAIYGGSDDALYYCIEESGSTYLYSYRQGKEESVLLYDLTNDLEGRQMMSFVYEQGLLVYTTLEKELVVLNVEEKKSASIPLNGMVTLGKDLLCVKGNIICQSFSQESMQASLRALYLKDIVLEDRKTSLEGTVIVRCNDLLNGVLDADRIEKMSGISTEFITGEMYSDEFLAEIMAGNPEIDIYVFSMNHWVAQALKEKGVFVPLNSSKAIKEYQKRCFSYIAEGMETDTGELWMLPVAVSGNGIWYVEENLEKMSISTDSFSTMDSFLTLSKELKKRLTETEYRAYVESSMNLLTDWQRQYESVYCDFSEGKVNYQTKKYRDFFESAWSGWKIYSATIPEHPYLQTSYSEKYSGMYNDHPKFNADAILYKWDTITELNNGNLKGWRIAPTPKYSEQVQGNVVTVMGLIINPYSEQEDLAMAYLEEISRSPMEVYKTYTSFLFEGIDTYSETYDITLPVIQDLYRLFEEGMIGESVYPNYYSIVNDYQEGRYTLDEAIDALQREVEMWLNE